MAVDVKLLHIVSDNNLIMVVHRFVLSPFRTLRLNEKKKSNL